MMTKDNQNIETVETEETPAIATMAPLPLTRKIIMGLICLLTIFALFFLSKIIIAANDKPEAKKRTFNTLAILATPAQTSDVTLKVKAQGESAPGIEIDLVPEVGGKIVYVSPQFDDGGFFKKGELLVRIDPSDYNVNISRASAALAQAEQLLAREKAEGLIARSDYAELGNGTPSDFALRIPQQAQAQASVDAARAELDGAKLQLKRTEVRAPFTGRVRSKVSDIGQFVSPGSRLGRIFSTDDVEIKLTLTDNDLSKLDLPLSYVAKSRETAPKVILSAVIGGKLRKWYGNIMRTDSSYDPMTRAITAIVEVKDPYGKGASRTEDGVGVPLAPGLFVDALIEGASISDTITFPRDGLRPDDEVYVVSQLGRAEIRKVTVIDASPERAVISSGVSAGELVVLSPMEKSRLSMDLRALDVNDPTTILVEPPKRKRPNTANDDAKSFWTRLFGKKQESVKLNRRNKNELVDALSADYQNMLDGLTREEKKRFNKMNSQDKAKFIKRKLAPKP